MSKIFDIEFSDKTQEQTIDFLCNILDIESKGLTHVVTANPEILMNSLKQKGLKKILVNADMVTADGIGVVKASKLFKQSIPERVTGYDTVIGIFEKKMREKKPLRVYMLGSTPEHIKKAAFNVKNEYNYIQVVGYNDGYFSKKDEIKIVAEINDLRPDLLLVGLGSPKQEQFIYNFKTKLNVKVAIGVGGVFDVLSGSVKRAPVWIQKINLEWFYRLLQNPKRMFRQTVLIRFALKVFWMKLFNKY